MNKHVLVQKIASNQSSSHVWNCRGSVSTGRTMAEYQVLGFWADDGAFSLCWGPSSRIARLTEFASENEMLSVLHNGSYAIEGGLICLPRWYGGLSLENIQVDRILVDPTKPDFFLQGKSIGHPAERCNDHIMVHFTTRGLQIWHKDICMELMHTNGPSQDGFNTILVQRRGTGTDQVKCFWRHVDRIRGFSDLSRQMYMGAPPQVNIFHDFKVAQVHMQDMRPKDPSCSYVLSSYKAPEVTKHREDEIVQNGKFSEGFKRKLPAEFSYKMHGKKMKAEQGCATKRTRSFQSEEQKDSKKPRMTSDKTTQLSVATDEQGCSRSRNVLITGYFLLRIFSIVGAIVIGYSNSLLSAILSMPVFFLRTSPSLYNDKEFSEDTNFCQFFDVRYLILTSMCPLCSTCLGWVGLCLSKKLGRKPVLFLASLLQISGTIIILIFPGKPSVFGAILFASGAALNSQVVPMMGKESVPKTLKRTFKALANYQILGNTVAGVVNYIAAFDKKRGWILSILVLDVFLVIHVLLSYFLEETPIFFLEKGKENEAREVLKRLRHDNGLVDLESASVQEEELGELLEEVRNTKTRFRELFPRDIVPTWKILVASKILPQAMSLFPLVFFGPLIGSSVSPNPGIPRVPFLVTLISSTAGLLATFVVSWYLSAIKRRKLLMGASALAAIAMLPLLLIFFTSTHPLINMSKALSVAVAGIMVLNYIAVTLLTNPHGWTNKSLGASDDLGGGLLNSFSSAVTVVKNIASVKFFCGFGAWALLIDFLFSLICFVFVRGFIHDEI